MFAYYIGSFISRSTIHSKVLSFAATPTIFQMINFVLWWNILQYDLFQSFYIIFALLIWVGVQGGMAYSNFFYLANTRTNLPCDFNLHYTERELCVNLLLLANDLGIIFAGLIGFLIQAQFFPQTLYNPPG